MIAVDASVVVSALTDASETGEAVRARLRDETIVAPALMDIEVTSAIRKGVRAGRLEERAARRALDDLRSMPWQEIPHGVLLKRVWELRDNVTAYDASYVAVAELRKVPLLTLDGKLARATGPDCEFELL